MLIHFHTPLATDVQTSTTHLWLRWCCCFAYYTYPWSCSTSLSHGQFSKTLTGVYVCVCLSVCVLSHCVEVATSDWIAVRSWTLMSKMSQDDELLGHGSQELISSWTLIMRRFLLARTCAWRACVMAGQVTIDGRAVHIVLSCSPVLCVDPVKRRLLCRYCRRCHHSVVCLT